MLPLQTHSDHIKPSTTQLIGSDLQLQVGNLRSSQFFDHELSDHGKRNEHEGNRQDPSPLTFHWIGWGSSHAVRAARPAPASASSPRSNVVMHHRVRA